jgi:protein TonB
MMKDYYKILSVPIVAGFMIIGFTLAYNLLEKEFATIISDKNYNNQAVNLYNKKDFSRLFDMANKGYSEAQFYLALSYDKGNGVEEDDAVAAVWYERSAEKGNMEAQYNLGLMHQNGQGVPQYYATAVKWFRKAAEQGDVRAQYSLGLSYKNGTGVDRDYVQAHKWFNLAAAGAKDVNIRGKATRFRDWVASRMSSRDIAKAQRLAGSWRDMKGAEIVQGPPRIVAVPKLGATPARQAEQSVPKLKLALRGSVSKASPPVMASAAKPAVVPAPATPRGRGNVFSDDDYPSASRVAGEQGLSIASYVVGVDGRVSQCEIVQSSGFKRLDDATCSIMTRRFRFNPLIRDGQPVPERKTQPVNWRLTAPVAVPPTPTGTIVYATPVGRGNVFSNDDYPSASRRAEEEGVTRASYVVGVDGRVSQCEIVQSSGFKRLDDATCSIITRRFRFNSATLNGQPVGERKSMPVRWRLTGNYRKADYTPIGPFNCKATAAQLRTLAVAKGGEDAAKATQLVATGEKLCAEASKPEAGKKFARAAELLGTDLAALANTNLKEK